MVQFKGYEGSVGMFAKRTRLVSTPVHSKCIARRVASVGLVLGKKRHRKVVGHDISRRRQLTPSAIMYTFVGVGWGVGGV